MPDKIVNHFVLADGSIAKYEYDGLLKAPDKRGLLFGEDITTSYQNGFITLNVGIGNAVNPTPTVRTDYKYIIIPCKAGDKFIISGSGAESARPWAFTDTTYIVERVAWANEVDENLLLIANIDGFLIANARLAYSYSLYQYNNLSIIQDEAVGNYNITSAYGYSGYIDCSNGVGSAITLTPTYNTAYKYITLKCKKGDIFEINACGAVAARLWMFLDETKTIVSIAEENEDSQENAVVVTAPSNGWFVSNARYHSTNDYVRKVIYYKNYSYIDNLLADTPNIVKNALESENVVHKTSANYVNNRYIDTDEAVGTVIDVTSPIGNGSYCYWLVHVQSGDIVKVTGTGSTTARLWALTDEQYRLISNSEPSLVATDLLVGVEQDGYCIINSRNDLAHDAEVIRNGEIISDITSPIESDIKQYMLFYMGRNYGLGYANAKDRLNMVNYLGNNQNTHPKVLYFSNGLFGHNYWMAYTPYPYGSTSSENPCIAFSDDGFSWSGIPANPLATPNDNGTTNYNSDTHLLYREDTGNLECWYRHCNETDRIETIYRRTSSDGLVWQNAEAVFTSSGATNKALSPAVFYDGENEKYCMWLVSATGGFHIEYWEAGATASSWTKIRDITLTYEYDEKSYYPWHLDVIKENGKFIILVMVKDTWSERHDNEWILFLATSDDNITYTTPSAVMIGNPSGWDTRLYRSSIVNVGEKYRIYYAGRNEATYYAMGITESATLENFIGIF